MYVGFGRSVFGAGIFPKRGNAGVDVFHHNTGAKEDGLFARTEGGKGGALWLLANKGCSSQAGPVIIVFMLYVFVRHKEAGGPASDASPFR